MNIERRIAATLVVLTGLGGPLRADEGPNPAQQTPHEVGLREETGRRLAQLDVTVHGPKAAVASLTRDDFELLVMSRHVHDFLVDRVCRVSSDAAANDSIR